MGMLNVREKEECTYDILSLGEVMLRIEPFRRAMKWKDFEYDPPTGGD